MTVAYLFMLVYFEVVLQLDQLALNLAQNLPLGLQFIHSTGQRVLSNLERYLLRGDDLRNDVVLLNSKQPATQTFARRRRHFDLVWIEVRVGEVLLPNDLFIFSMT